jgi:hypothetical protein
MVRALLTWTADVSLVLGIAVLALSVLLVPEVILTFGQDTAPHPPKQCVEGSCHTPDCISQNGRCPSDADCKRTRKTPRGGASAFERDPFLACVRKHQWEATGCGGRSPAGGKFLTPQT